MLAHQVPAATPAQDPVPPEPEPAPEPKADSAPTPEPEPAPEPKPTPEPEPNSEPEPEHEPPAAPTAEVEPEPEADSGWTAEDLAPELDVHRMRYGTLDQRHREVLRLVAFGYEDLAMCQSVGLSFTAVERIVSHSSRYSM